jgi:hypothetical protein
MGPVVRSAVAVACSLLVIGCAQESGAPGEEPSSSASPAVSGVRGVVVQSPSCGGARRCPPRRVVRTVTAREVGGRGTAVSTISDADGRFELLLPPGRYRLRTDTPRVCPVAELTVIEERFTRVRIACESGLV